VPGMLVGFEAGEVSGSDVQAPSGYQPQVCSLIHGLDSSLANNERLRCCWKKLSVGLGVWLILMASVDDVVAWGVLWVGLWPGVCMSGQNAWSWKPVFGVGT